MEKKQQKEKTVKSAPKTKVIPKPKSEYIEAVGRRKTSIARVRVYIGEAKKGSYNIEVNGISFEKYFPISRQRVVVCAPFATFDLSFRTTVVVSGGGMNSQSEAVRLGIARVLVKHAPEYRSKLKALGYLKRDPRMVERKKFGSRKARRPQQWRKR